MHKSILIILLVALAASSSGFANDEPRATVSGGTIQGRALPAPGGAVFRGIPFAAPPVGDLRWREPQPVKPWTGTLKTVEYGAPCMQSVGGNGWNREIAAASKEDCLYLNVWTSEWPPRQSRPVMLWIHGGGNSGGSAIGSTGTEPSFDGERLSRRGVVVVTISYRLGIFGFIAHPELSAESPHGASGNYGILDQVAALRWVRDNIARFGGDPANVTVFGQSAGAQDTGMLMASPLARGLFAKAIAQSGTVMIGGRLTPTLKESEQKGIALAQRLNAPPTGAIQYMRTLPAEELLESLAGSRGAGARAEGGRGAGIRLDASIDGYVITRSPIEIFRSGAEAPVPLVIGNNGRERPGQGGAEGLKEAIGTFYGTMSDKATALYEKVPSYAPWGDANAQFTTDTQFRCSAVQIASWHRAHAPTWEYEFTRGYEPVGANHSWELQYVFGNLLERSNDPMDRTLSDEVQLYWTRFAKTGNPNAAGLPEWPPLDEKTKSYLELAADGPVVKTALRGPFCSLFSERLAQEESKAAGKE
jgi:para-nitrobenzyl esterase